MNAVERYRIELCRAKKRNSIRFVSHLQCQMPTKLSPSIHAHSGSLISSHPASTSVTSSGNVQKNVELEFQGSSKKNHETSAVGCSNPENFISQSGLAVAKKKRIHMQVIISIWFFRYFDKYNPQSNAYIWLCLPLPKVYGFVDCINWCVCDIILITTCAKKILTTVYVGLFIEF